MRVFIETTIPSYLTARPARDVLQLARQEVAREWWETRIQSRLRRIADDAGYGLPFVCTPDEAMDERS
mgnify:CR=1 FL=1